MIPSRFQAIGMVLILMVATIPSLLAAEPTVNLSGYRTESEVSVEHRDGQLRLSWPSEPGPGHDARGHLVLDLQPGRPLIRTMGIFAGANPASPVLESLDPSTYLLVGTRQAPAGRPPEMSVFNVFFDSPANRPFQTYRSRLDLKQVRVTSHGRRTTVAVSAVEVGPFSGELRFTIYALAPLLHVEAVVHTQEDRRAILYDTGLMLSKPERLLKFAWVDTEGNLHREEPASDTTDRHLAVRHRVLIAETPSGSIACFPPPHQFFSPRDLTENLRTVWYGKDHRGLDDRFGFGIRQSEKGGGSFVPWFNAPPGTDQRLGVFYLLSRGTAEDALKETLRFTHGDRFPKLPGYRTMTSHWHMATAVAAMNEKAKGGPRSNARPGRDVQGDGRGNRPPGRIPRRRTSPGSRPGPSGRGAGDV